MNPLPFSNRETAGKFLAGKIERLSLPSKGIVLALPRGGVPVAFEVATRLRWPLDVFTVRKLGAPGHEEFAMGAIASGGVRFLHPGVEARLENRRVIEQVTEREERELERREKTYRAGSPPLDLRGCHVILVDDGLATGASMRVAVRAVNRIGAASCQAAVPVGSSDSCDALREEADEVICAVVPEAFHSVGEFYEDFTPTTDEEVCDLLGRARQQIQGDL